ncbi:S-adenosyl-L-methionine-dependent methyltransferase [Talaromyces proteolyticus]|uniref:S-adenosyl-L-methionine-dependent methyltransferase n=1 Tax=Talaromyces proteolyticus TaxID=1131652 RepID=A0AAD4KRY1_9EURO|nr:S-adenosyl-L-methionine-dependent methyltransferase [Talaromyces proteolyticus]KAH8695207.1 S-adenosyl-L-methionine-dependent methyltransferase [Talaromyces proteolyticus]
MERLDGGTRYDLGRDFVGSARLNLQHYLWKETLGFDLHPRAEADNSSEGLRIADVGTGTGVFILSLARRLSPSCSFVGFDISDEQFPVPDGVPDNVAFRIADAMSDPPDEFIGQFDIVHLRLFFCVVEDNNPLPPLNFCLKLLKPGGFLQWDEYDQAYTKAYKLSPQAPIAAMTAMREGFSNGRQLGWITTLKDFCETHGVQDVECIRTGPPPDFLTAYTQMVLVLYLEHASLHDNSGNKEKGDSLRLLVAKCAEELKQGGVCRHWLQVVTGRKRF